MKIFQSLLYLGLLASPVFANVSWLDLDFTNGQIVADPVFGNVQVSWTVSGSTMVSGWNNGGGSVGPFSWASSERINFVDDLSNFSATASFTFLDGPVNPSEIYLNVVGLGHRSTESEFTSITLDKNVTFLGEWLTFDGPSNQSAIAATHTWDAAGLPGLNTNGEFHRLASGPAINSLNFAISGIDGDGFGMNIGSSTIPEPSSSLLATFLLGLIAVRQRQLN